MLMQGALQVFKDFIQLRRFGSDDSFGTEFFDPVFQSMGHEQNGKRMPQIAHVVRYGTYRIRLLVRKMSG